MARGLRQCLHDITFYLILLIFIATLGSLQFGFHLAELNAPEDVITCRKKSISTRSLLSFLRPTARPDSTSGPDDHTNSPPFDCIPMTNALFATVSSLFTLGGLLGALLGGPYSSRSGRLPAMRATAVFYLAGSGIETAASSVWILTLGRFLSGIGAGASTVIVPLYISEIAPPEERGLFGYMTQVSINVGILITQTLGFFLSHDGKWRVILGTGVGAAIAQGLGLLVVPESPSWLAAHGKVAQGERILRRIRGGGSNVVEEASTWDQDGSRLAEEEGLLAQSDDTATASSPAEPSPAAISKDGEVVHMGFIQVVKDPLYRPAIIAVVGVMFVQQLCGINSIIMYSVSLLADLLPVSSALLSILISLVNLVTTIACSPLPDRLGRKTCLLLSVVGQGSSAFVLALSIIFGAKILSAIAVLFFVGFFAVGLGPVPFILASELVGQEAVGATQSWCLAANYTATFLVAQFFPIVNKALNKALGGQGWVYFIFAGLAVGSAVFVSWKIPETKGKKDVDEVWGRARRLD